MAAGHALRPRAIETVAFRLLGFVPAGTERGAAPSLSGADVSSASQRTRRPHATTPGPTGGPSPEPTPGPSPGPTGGPSPEPTQGPTPGPSCGFIQGSDAAEALGWTHLFFCRRLGLISSIFGSPSCTFLA